MNKETKSPIPLGIKLTGTGCDPRTGIVYRRIEFVDYRGKPRQLLFAAGKFKDRDAELVRQLERAGCLLPLSRKAINEVIAKLDAQHTDTEFTVASAVGWFGKQDELFCTPLKVYGTLGIPMEIDFSDLSANHKIARKGKFKHWKSSIAGMTCGNRVLMFVLASAFAGPLLKLLGIESGGFQLVASSSSGKSTCLAVAGSVWGSGFEHWLMTTNALDRLALTYSDILLLLDEAGLAPGSAKQLLESAYRLCCGEGKHRLTDTEAHSTHRVFFLSTSENAMTDLAMREGAGWDPGQLVRFMDIRADGGKGMGVIENLHGASSPGRFADQLKAATKEQHGVAGDRYLERLMREMAADRTGLREWLLDRMAVYDRHAPQLGLGRFHERVTKRFSLVYAAGALAIRFGILPFTRAELRKAVRYCHKQAITDALASFAKAEMSGVDVVKTFLAEHRAEFRDITSLPVKGESDAVSAPGYIAYLDGGSEYLFEREFFRNVVCQSHDWRKVVKDLRARGYLNLNKGGKATVFRTFPTCQGRKRERVYSISARLLKS